MIPQAQDVGRKYHQLFTKFAACHNIYNSADVLSDAVIDKLGELCYNFLVAPIGSFIW